MAKTAGMWLALPAAMLLAGCGGGGTNGPPPTSAAPTPTPSPTPTPTPTPTTSAAGLFGLTQDAPLGLIALIKDASGTSWASDSEVQMGWLSTPATFAMFIESYGSGILEDDPDEAAPSARYLVNGQGTRLASVSAFIPTTNVEASAYALPILWSPLKGSTDPDASSGSGIYFSKASVGSPPASGGATYAFGSPPTSTAKLTFDFAAGTVSGEVPLTFADAFGPYPETRYVLDGGKYDKASGKFSGTFAIPGSGFSGEVRGQIIGTAGQAMAIAIRGAVYDPYLPGWVAQNSIVAKLRG